MPFREIHNNKMKLANSEPSCSTKKNMKQLKSQKIMNNKECYIEFYRNLSLKSTSSDELIVSTQESSPSQTRNRGQPSLSPLSGDNKCMRLSLFVLFVMIFAVFIVVKESDSFLVQLSSHHPFNPTSKDPVGADRQQQQQQQVHFTTNNNLLDESVIMKTIFNNTAANQQHRSDSPTQQQSADLDIKPKPVTLPENLLEKMTSDATEFNLNPTHIPSQLPSQSFIHSSANSLHPISGTHSTLSNPQPIPREGNTWSIDNKPKLKPQLQLPIQKIKSHHLPSLLFDFSKVEVSKEFIQSLYKKFPKHTIPNTTLNPYYDVHPSIFSYDYSKHFPHNFTKVVVPAVFKEYLHKGLPPWIYNTTIQQRLGFSVFLYQKLNASAPNYMAKNRGTEGGVFLRYIVDHYDSFPDVAIFVHADPSAHNPYWLEQIGCIRPNATYMNINFRHIERGTEEWIKKEMVWVEQCWRDILKIVWGSENDPVNFNKKLSALSPVKVAFSCCQQFILSREMVHRRPLQVWKKLLHIVNEQDVCHEGEPDYANLFAHNRYRWKSGPESTGIVTDKSVDMIGKTTQGGAMEHLAHVVYGGHDLLMKTPTMRQVCDQFEENCPFSPCFLQHLDY